jgi:hypothetical protein
MIEFNEQLLFLPLSQNIQIFLLLPYCLFCSVCSNLAVLPLNANNLILTPSGRKVSEGEEKRERKNAVNSGHMEAARTNLLFCLSQIWLIF